MKTASRFLGLVLCLGLVGLGARAADSVEAVVGKARAHVGPEAAIEAVKSLRFVGTLETTEQSAEGPKQRTLKIELIFKKPFRQLITVTTDRKVEKTGLDDYEAWQLQEDPQDPKNWVLSFLPPAQLRGVRANTWENISFFRADEGSGVRIEDQGTAVVDGISCRKLAYLHADPIFFIRYFAADTGKLVMTETNQGVKTREAGELNAGGLKFARQVLSSHPANGQPDVLVTITFSSVTVNEEFPNSLFAVPSQPAKGL